MRDVKVATSMQVLQQRGEGNVGRGEGHDADRDYRIITVEVGKDPSHRARGRGGYAKEYEQAMRRSNQWTGGSRRSNGDP